MRDIELPPKVIPLLACPQCRVKLVLDGVAIAYRQKGCQQLFLINKGARGGMTDHIVRLLAFRGGDAER